MIANSLGDGIVPASQANPQTGYRSRLDQEQHDELGDGSMDDCKRDSGPASRDMNNGVHKSRHGECRPSRH